MNNNLVFHHQCAYWARILDDRGVIACVSSKQPAEQSPLPGQSRLLWLLCCPRQFLDSAAQSQAQQGQGIQVKPVQYMCMCKSTPRPIQSISHNVTWTSKIANGCHAGFPLAPVIWTLHLYRYFSQAQAPTWAMVGASGERSEHGRATTAAGQLSGKRPRP